ncbi:TauD/TfdA family dioxygenase [Larsenimonas salina]|uniref:TauD/TfdA family dioxygenase n=1 Tax=Larsenimonas salina TaxID=1295565 RepID=UPI00207488E3|nr:TauD/TfdA family dioxygenase [Larsenimonas salina]MCM5703850.1 TauD/TfdA family dioxygenase [Larsenimonas salina]
MSANIDFEIVEQPPAIHVYKGGQRYTLSPLWLRERTQAHDQLEPMTQQRLFDSHAIDINLTITSLSKPSADQIQVLFSDSHEEIFDLNFLAVEIRDDNHFPVATSWDATLDQKMLRFDWTQVIANDETFQQSLDAYLRYGYLVLFNVPTDPERILEVGAKYGYVKETNFGRYFEVYSRPSGNDLAYRSVALGPHTDNPYRNPVPGIQLLHCLVNETSGGLSTLVDSLRVLETLKHEMLEGYQLLKQTPVRFRFIDAGTELVTHRSMIQTDANGQPTGVHYSPRLDALPLLSDKETRLFHQTRQRLSELFNDPRFEVRFALGGGELMMFDNSRVLHGRTSYDTSEGHRHLQGCYLDTDGPRERYASLLKTTKAKEEIA